MVVYEVSACRVNPLKHGFAQPRARLLSEAAPDSFYIPLAKLFPTRVVPNKWLKISRISRHFALIQL